MSRSSLLFLTAVLVGCASSEPEPVVVGAAKYDRAFDAAVAAANDVGIQVRSADRPSGRIAGSKGGVEVSIWLQWQPNGSTKIEFSAPGSTESPKLSDKWSAAYNRRMGR